jgi:hypothetical protein
VRWTHSELDDLVTVVKVGTDVGLVVDLIVLVLYLLVVDGAIDDLVVETGGGLEVVLHGPGLGEFEGSQVL